MRVRALTFAAMALLSSVAAAAPFCAVTATGTNCWYYDVPSCRQAAGPSGACVVNSNDARTDGGTRQTQSIEFNRTNPFIDTYQREMQEGARRRAEDQEWELRQLEIEQRRRNLARQSTDPRLLPLSPDGGVSPETHSAIMSTLFAALDMNAPNTSRDWRNPQTGASGTVLPKEIVQNIFGEPCRAFIISLSIRGQERSTSGTACRKNGQWVWQGN